MQSKKSIKIIMIVLGLMVLTAGIIMAVRFFSKKTDSYRSIQIYQLEGKAEIEREGTGTITAANNLYLESGDRVRLDPGSSMRLRLDDDKYLMVEENSVLSIQAEGSDENSKTSICLEQGAVTNEIENKLTGGSAYEVNSPNSIMAVRGTIFRAEGYVDETGKTQTKISTFDGTVAFQPVAPDGTKQDEVLVKAGKEAVIQSSSDSVQYLKEPSDISFSDLPPQALHFLADLMEKGAPITGISQDELQKLIQESGAKDAADPERETGSREPSGQNNTPEPDPSLPGATDTQSGGQPFPDTDTASGQDSPDREPSAQNSPAKTPSGQETDKKENKNYTVTFRYQGKVFGVQTIKYGHAASKPKLSPSPTGRWDFDFSQKIRKDTEIHWISE
ncbi:MAG: hypothetical protein HFG38_05195 [Eubacterium sp.]|jgi:Uncharacterized protein conserved in bacteria|nr:hypothetical protein [Eubacterium sp.]